MPNYDGSGPIAGSRNTLRGMGRGMGPCSKGFRKGFGCNGFLNRRFVSSKEEAGYLKEEKDLLEKDLNALNERLGEIEKD